MKPVFLMYVILAAMTTQCIASGRKGFKSDNIWIAGAGWVLLGGGNSRNHQDKGEEQIFWYGP